MVLVAGCVAAGGITAPPATSSRGSTPPTATPDTSPRSSGNCGRADLAAATLNPYTIASLVRYGDGFLVGEVTAIGPAAFGIGSVGGVASRWRILTPVDVQVEQVLQGQTEPGAVRLVFEGGTVGCYTETNNLAPLLAKGTRYVFVVSEFLARDGIVPPDQREIDFAWRIDAAGIVHTSLGPLSLTSLEVSVAAASSAKP
jgi:hypothetical protein